MYSPLKNNQHHQNQNYYATTHHQAQPRYDLTASSIAYLNAANSVDATGLFYANPSDQHHTSSLSATSIPAGYVTAAPTFADIAFGTKGLAHAFGAKNPYSATSMCLNGLKKRKRRYKKPPELRKVLPKNSLMLLHEYRPNIEYRFLCQSGPIHRPLFTMCVDIAEHKFEGTGKTKKEARMMAAERALEFLIQNPEYIQKPAPGQNSSLSATSTSEKSGNDSSSTHLEEEGNSDEDDNEDDDESQENVATNATHSSPSEILHDSDRDEAVKRFKKEESESTQTSLSAESKS